MFALTQIQIQTWMKTKTKRSDDLHLAVPQFPAKRDPVDSNNLIQAFFSLHSDKNVFERFICLNANIMFQVYHSLFNSVCFYYYQLLIWAESY